LFLYTDGAPDRMVYDGWSDWVRDHAAMRTVSDLPNSGRFYKEFNTGWTGDRDLLSTVLNSVAQQIAHGDPLSYNWVCGAQADGVLLIRPVDADESSQRRRGGLRGLGLRGLGLSGHTVLLSGWVWLVTTRGASPRRRTYRGDLERVAFWRIRHEALARGPGPKTSKQTSNVGTSDS
jgi:hypothetical protein